MNMQELRVESADKDLHESCLQLQSHRMELYLTNQVNENLWREQAWLQAELENRARDHQETRMRTLQEVEELKKFCCTEAARTQQLRADDLLRPELQEIHSTVNQLTVQIQELKD